MTKKSKKNSKGDTFEWEETDEVREAIKKLSFVKAGDSLGISAAAVSKQIKSLEEKLGVILFYRTTRVITPTEHAIKLFNSLDKNKDEFDTILSEIKSSYKILHDLFLIISVESNFSNPSGCSIDKLINFIKKINQLYDIDFLNRLNISYRDGNMVKLVDIAGFKKLILEGTIKSDTIIFNNTLNIKAELNENWEIKASKSWCKKYFYGKQN